MRFLPVIRDMHSQGPACSFQLWQRNGIKKLLIPGLALVLNGCRTPLRYLRINCTLQQHDEFLNFYGFTEGDGMYLPRPTG